MAGAGRLWLLERKDAAGVELRLDDLPEKTAYVPFFCDIAPPRAQELIRLCGQAVTEGAEALYLAFCTPGGNVNDGLSIHALLRTMGVPIVTHNLSTIASIGLPLYMAGDLRVASPGSAFFFHRVGATFGDDYIDTDVAEKNIVEWKRAEERIEQLMKASGFNGDLRSLMGARGNLFAEDAVDNGLVHEIRDFAIPRKCTLWRIV